MLIVKPKPKCVPGMGKRIALKMQEGYSRPEQAIAAVYAEQSQKPKPKVIGTKRK